MCLLSIGRCFAVTFAGMMNPAAGLWSGTTWAITRWSGGDRASWPGPSPRVGCWRRASGFADYNKTVASADMKGRAPGEVPVISIEEDHPGPGPLSCPGRREPTTTCIIRRSGVAGPPRQSLRLRVAGEPLKIQQPGRRVSPSLLTHPAVTGSSTSRNWISRWLTTSSVTPTPTGLRVCRVKALLQQTGTPISMISSVCHEFCKEWHHHEMRWVCLRRHTTIWNGCWWRIYTVGSSWLILMPRTAQCN